MANRGNRARQTEEVDNTINYVQCDGLVSKLYSFYKNLINFIKFSSITMDFIKKIVLKISGLRLVDMSNEKIHTFTFDNCAFFVRNHGMPDE